MVHEINIYGDIVPFKWYNDGSEFDRSDLNKLIDSLDLKKGDELIYNLHSFGGCTTTAFAMYNKLKRIKQEKEITLTSRADGYGASSTVILFLAADRRIGSKYLKLFVHNAWTWMMGDKKEAQKIFEELEKVDNEIAELYSEETKITKEVALQLMSESRDLTIDECMEYGFYTELENVKAIENSMVFNSIISRNSQNRQKIQNNMSKNKSAERKSIMQKIESFLKGTKNKIVFTAENAELDFYDLNEEDTPKVGDKALFDGKPAGESNGGVYVVQSGETYTFEGEELKEITPKEENDEESELQVENEALKEEVQNLKDEIKNLKSEKATISNSLKEAKSIIKNFQDINEDEEDEEDDDEKQKRDSKKKNMPQKRNLFKNLKH